MFNPSIQQISRNDRLKQDLFDLQEHKSEIPEYILPNMMAYPIFVLTGPSIMLNGEIKSLAQSSTDYLEMLGRCKISVGVENIGGV